MNISIGFRMKFKTRQQEELEETIKQYATLFERYEIKVTDSFDNVEYVRDVVLLSEKYLKSQFSFHLPKNILEDERELKKCELLFQILQDMGYEGNLITHIPTDIDFDNYKSILEKLSQIIPDKSILLLENIVVEDCMGYLIKIDKLFDSINKSNIGNIKFCLDFGHLFFSFYKNNKMQEEELQQLSKCTSILKNVKEIHLHDFNTELDHLHLGEGLLNLEDLIHFILVNKIECPIILEITISNPNEDGYQQIELVKRSLSSKKEKEQ